MGVWNWVEVNLETNGVHNDVLDINVVNKSEITFMLVKWYAYCMLMLLTLTLYIARFLNDLYLTFCTFCLSVTSSYDSWIPWGMEDIPEKRGQESIVIRLQLTIRNVITSVIKAVQSLSNMKHKVGVYYTISNGKRNTWLLSC